MATLLDTLQQRLASAPAPAAQPQLNIAEVLRAKKGKGGATQGGPAASSIGAGIAADVGQQQLAQQQQTGQLAAQQLGAQQTDLQQKQQLAQEQLQQNQRMFQGNVAGQVQQATVGSQAQEQLANQQRQANTELKVKDLNDKASLALQSLAAERKLTRDNIFSDARMDNKQLEFRQDAADLEQKAFVLALGDKEYLNELGRIGQQRNLQDDVAFNKEMQSVIFGNDLTKVMDQYGFQAGQNVKERDLKKQLAELSNGQIIEMANAAAKAANMQAAWSAGGSALSKGADYLARPNTKGAV
jgi:hypothetical protein